MTREEQLERFAGVAAERVAGREDGCRYRYIGNSISAKVDGWRGTVRYRVALCYDRVHEDGHADLWEEELDDFVLGRDEISRRGGPAQVMRDLADRYGPDLFER